MVRAENKTGQDLCCANSNPKSTRAELAREGFQTPHRQTPLTPALCLRTAFPGHSQEAFLGLWGRKWGIISCHQEEVDEEDCKGFQKDPMQVFHLSFLSFSFYCLTSKVCTICTPKAHSSWWKAQHRKSKIPSAPSTLLSFKHKTQARTEEQEATKGNFYPRYKSALIRNKTNPEWSPEVRETLTKGGKIKKILK